MRELLDAVARYLVSSRTNSRGMTVARRSRGGDCPFSRMRLYSAVRASAWRWAFVTAPQMMASVVSGRSAVRRSEMRLSSQAVVIVFCSNASVSRSLMRYSTVVLKSPRIESSCEAKQTLARSQRNPTKDEP